MQAGRRHPGTARRTPGGGSAGSRLMPAGASPCSPVCRCCRPSCCTAGQHATHRQSTSWWSCAGAHRGREQVPLQPGASLEHQPERVGPQLHLLSSSMSVAARQHATDMHSSCSCALCRRMQSERGAPLRPGASLDRQLERLAVQGHIVVLLDCALRVLRAPEEHLRRADRPTTARSRRQPCAEAPA